LLLRHASDGVELEYVPVDGAGPARQAAAEAAAPRPDSGQTGKMDRARLVIPRDQDNVILSIDGQEVRLTNLRKIFWPELRLTKGDLLQYYADVAACCCRTSPIARW
jgi:hypothetical protein